MEESPSFFEAIVRFPGAVVRFPSAAVDTLDAINALAERLDRLMAMLEQFEGGVNLAGTGVDFASTGISQAIAGLQQAVGSLDSSRPPLSYTPSALRNLAERLGATTVAFVGESGEDDDRVDEPPFLQLDVFVAELVRIAASMVGSIPGLGQVFRAPTASSGFGPSDVEDPDDEGPDYRAG